MFTITSPENPNMGRETVRTLRAAIVAKHSWQDKNPGTHAIITDSFGYVVTTQEQSNYLLSAYTRTPV